MNVDCFQLADLQQQHHASGEDWNEFLGTTTMSMGLYRLGEGANDADRHAPHDRDEVYVGIRGKGWLTADQQEFEIEAGTIVYVKAGVEHHFHDVTEDLTVLVYFAGASNSSLQGER